ncbi:MAG: P-loop NTPase [Synergistaceae bacterium]
MSENCTHQCGNCEEKCSDNKEAFDFRVAPHPLSSIGKVIGIVSGKGGVGKSLVTSLLAVEMQKKGNQTAILDADITGPSIPKAFGITEQATSNAQGILPVTTTNGTDIMSLNLLLEDQTTPVIWRGPAIADVVKQFWSDVIWTGVDYMFVDMPPGTGDVPLTVFQSLPVDGIIIVSSPQELVSMIVEKAVRMAEQMNIPILGLVENMSYIECPDCGKVIKIFGESKAEETAKKHNLKVLAKLPIDPEIASLCDTGKIEDFNKGYLDEAVKVIEALEAPIKKNNRSIRVAVTTDPTDNTVFQHFGHTEIFTVYNVSNGEVINKETIDSNGSGHEALGGFLAENRVDLLLCGGIGAGAKEVLKEAGIELISGVKGDIDKVITEFLAGNIEDDPTSECNHHDHEHSEGHGQCHGCKNKSCH